MVDLDLQFIESLRDKPRLEQIQSVKKSRDSFNDELKKFTTSFQSRVFRIIFGDPMFRQAFASGRYRKDQQIVLDEQMIARNKPEFERVAGDLTEFFSHMIPMLQEELPLLNALDLIERAVENHRRLSQVLHLPEQRTQLEDSLAKLSKNRIFRMSKETICIECHFKSGMVPYYSSESFTVHHQLIDRCPSCG